MSPAHTASMMMDSAFIDVHPQRIRSQNFTYATAIKKKAMVTPPKMMSRMSPPVPENCLHRLPSRDGGAVDGGPVQQEDPRVRLRARTLTTVRSPATSQSSRSEFTEMARVILATPTAREPGGFTRASPDNCSSYSVLVPRGSFRGLPNSAAIAIRKRTINPSPKTPSTRMVSVTGFAKMLV
jgi:hypothetical protein